MDKREREAKQSNLGGGESAGGGFANPGDHGLGGGYTGKMSDITGGKTGGFKDLTGSIVCRYQVSLKSCSKVVIATH